MAPDSPRTILLTGKTGQVGHALRPVLSALGTVVAPGRDRLDLTDPVSVRAVVREVRPDVIVNAAAYTQVDAAETDEKTAHAVNAEAPGLQAAEAKRLRAWLIHYSTDYVFGGDAQTPYTEQDVPSPVNVYGETKLAGEHAVQASGANALILRTSGVYSDRRSNFVRTMLRLAGEDRPLKVVDDQILCPTWADWIATSTRQLIESILRDDGRARAGLYHLCSDGQTSWYAFAQAIFRAFGYEDVDLTPIPTSEYPTLATRPAYSALDTSRLQSTFGIDVPGWSEQLMAFSKDGPASRSGKDAESRAKEE